MCGSCKSGNILLYRLNEIFVHASRGDNPVSCLQRPSETPISHFIHFDPVLGGEALFPVMPLINDFLSGPM